MLKVNLHPTMSFIMFSTHGKQSSYVLFIHAALVGFESNNKYEVRNSMGQNVFYAVEENDCLSRQCCGPLRPFTIHVLDNFGQEVITVTRPLKCMSCFFPCCLQEVSEAACCVLRWFSSFTSSFEARFLVRIWRQITLCSPTIPHSAGGAVSPWQHSGVHCTTVAPVLPEIPCRERTQ